MVKILCCRPCNKGSAMVGYVARKVPAGVEALIV